MISTGGVGIQGTVSIMPFIQEKKLGYVCFVGNIICSDRETREQIVEV
jgi:hypothetical protein